MIRIPGRIPITIHLTFWIFSALIGYTQSYNVIAALIWVGVIFVSVLFHEFGHALTALAFGQSPQIELVALGGLTYYDGQKLPFWKQFLIVLNGPLFGFLLFGIATALLNISSIAHSAFAPILVLTRIINLFWTVVNLLPVLPLDGGQLLRILFEKLFGLKGFKYTLLVGIVVAIAISLLCFLFQEFFIGALFFLFAFQSYDTLRRSRHLSESDRDTGVRDLITRIEQLLQEDKKDDAAKLCEEARKKARSGLFYALATQYLAFLQYEKGLSLESYHLLVSIKEDLANDALCLLHKVAFDQHDFALVAELGPTCFQTLPSAETALRNALAHAELGQSTPALGWLRTAMQEGLVNVSEIIQMPSFDFMRQDPSFKEFLSDTQKE